MEKRISPLNNLFVQACRTLKEEWPMDCSGKKIIILWVNHLLNFFHSREAWFIRCPEQFCFWFCILGFSTSKLNNSTKKCLLVIGFYSVFSTFSISSHELETLVYFLTKKIETVSRSKKGNIFVFCSLSDLFIPGRSGSRRTLFHAKERISTGNWRNPTRQQSLAGDSALSRCENGNRVNYRLLNFCLFEILLRLKTITFHFQGS